MIYLAAPYTSYDPEIVDMRIAQFCRVDAKLCQQGLITVSPLSKHFIKDHATIPLTWEFWKTYSEKLMEKCDALYVIMLDGWDVSEGVLAEIELAKKMSLEIKYLDYRDFL
jgi:nucleoside 2-deoxyribosyltransferase